MRDRTILLLALVALVAAACGGGATTTTEGPDESATEAGIEVTLDNYPGGHTTLDKVPELVGYLIDAAAIH